MFHVTCISSIHVSVFSRQYRLRLVFRFDKTAPMWHEMQCTETLLLIGQWPCSRIRPKSDPASSRDCFFVYKCEMYMLTCYTLLWSEKLF